MRYNSNEEVYDNIGASLQNEYDKLYKKSEKIERSLFYKGALDETLTFGTEENRNGTIALSIPSAVLIALGVGAFALGTVSCLPVLNNLGRNVGPEQEQFLQNLSNFSFNLMGKSANNVVSGIKLLTIPATFSAISLPKKFLRDYRDKKLDEIDERLVGLDDMNTLLEDIKNGKDDPSLDFPREFLSLVDLTKNNKKFNVEIFHALANYRDGVLKKNDNVINEEELSELYDNFIAIIYEGKGASRSFSENPYVEELINSHYEEKERLEELEESTNYGKGK